MKLHTVSSLVCLALAAAPTAPAAAEAPKHFDPKGKPPSQFTIRGQQVLRQQLPFADERDFAEAKRGFVAAPARWIRGCSVHCGVSDPRSRWPGAFR